MARKRKKAAPRTCKDTVLVINETKNEYYSSRPKGKTTKVNGKNFQKVTANLAS